MKTLFLCTLLALPVGASARMIFGPNGTVYQQFERPGGATTFGNDGTVYQRFDHPNGGATTFGPNGQVWQEFGNRMGNPEHGRGMGGLGGLGNLND